MSRIESASELRPTAPKRTNPGAPSPSPTSSRSAVSLSSRAHHACRRLVFSDTIEPVFTVTRYSQRQTSYSGKSVASRVEPADLRSYARFMTKSLAPRENRTVTSNDHDPDPWPGEDVRDEVRKGKVCLNRSCRSRDEPRTVDISNTGNVTVLCARCRVLYGAESKVLCSDCWTMFTEGER